MGVNFASNATSFFPEKHGRKIAYIRKKISVYKKIYFRIYEKIFSHMWKFFSLRTQIYCPAHGDEFLFARRKNWVAKKGIFRSDGKELFFGGREIFLRTKRSFLPKRLGLVFGRKLFFLREESLPFAEGKGAEGAGLADDELADEGRRGEDRTKEVDARRDVDPCFLDAPCREELSPLHVQQIQLGSGLGEA